MVDVPSVCLITTEIHVSCNGKFGGIVPPSIRYLCDFGFSSSTRTIIIVYSHNTLTPRLFRLVFLYILNNDISMSPYTPLNILNGTVKSTKKIIQGLVLADLCTFWSEGRRPSTTNFAGGFATGEVWALPTKIDSKHCIHNDCNTQSWRFYR